MLNSPLVTAFARTMLSAVPSTLMLLLLLVVVFLLVVLRLAMLGKLSTLPTAKGMLPFVCLSYAQPSKYSWASDGRALRFVEQLEGASREIP